MDKLAMEAMNRGWALGPGTSIRRIDSDVEAARARAEAGERTPERPARFDWALLLAALGPMPRAAH